MHHASISTGMLQLYSYTIDLDLVALPYREMGWATYFVDESFLGCPLFGHMVGGSQPCVVLLWKTIRTIDSRKLLGEIYCDNSRSSLAKQVPLCM